MRLSALTLDTRKHVITGLAALGCAACAASPMAVTKADLGYRLVVENGTATVSGLVKAPKALHALSASLFERDAQGALRLAEAPLAGATVRALDASGKPNANVLPVQTDAQGRFTLRGLRLGEPAYLQAQFKSADDADRSLFAYVRPEREQVCSDVNLASTLVVHEMERSGRGPSMFNSDKLAQVIALAQGKLPDLLTDAVDGKAPDLNQALTGLIKQTTSSGPGLSPLPPAAGSTVDSIFKRDPDLKNGLEGAVDTYLDVTFTVQDFGANDAPVLHPDRIRQLLIGRVELVCQASQQTFAEVAFWLNNQPVGAAAFDGQDWVAALDTRTLPDGPYVLSAVGRPRGGEEPTVMRALVYVRNTAPARESGCAGWVTGGQTP
jgi:hypothetical protein